MPNFHVAECAEQLVATMMDVQRCTEYTIAMNVAEGVAGEATVAEVRRQCQAGIDSTTIQDIRDLCVAKASTYSQSSLMNNWRESSGNAGNVGQVSAGSKLFPS